MTAGGFSDCYADPQHAHLGRDAITVNGVAIPGVLSRHAKLRYRRSGAYPLTLTLTLYLDAADIDPAAKPWVDITQELPDLAAATTAKDTA